MWLVGLGVWLILQDALIFTVPSGQLAGRTEGWRHVSNRQEGRRMPQPFGWAWAAEQLCCQPLLCQPQPALFSASEQAVSQISKSFRATLMVSVAPRPLLVRGGGGSYRNSMHI